MYVDSDGKDNYIFKNNRYVRTVTTNSTHTIINTNTATHETYSISFVDPDNDPSKIGPKMRLVEVSDNDIEQALEKSGANSIKNHGLFKGMKYLLDNSNANSLERTGLMDFTGSGDYNIETDDVLYITTTNKDGEVAHNGIIMAIFCGVQEPNVLVYQERLQKLVLMSIISFMTSKAVSI